SYLERLRPPRHTLFPYTTLFRSCPGVIAPWKMFPPVRLKTRSRSGGASTWRSMTALLKFGAYSFTTSKHRSANASRWSSQELSRSEEHTSELQSLAYLVCRLLLE